MGARERAASQLPFPRPRPRWRPPLNSTTKQPLPPPPPLPTRSAPVLNSPLRRNRYRTSRATPGCPSPVSITTHLSFNHSAYCTIDCLHFICHLSRVRLDSDRNPTPKLRFGVRVRACALRMRSRTFSLSFTPHPNNTPRMRTRVVLAKPLGACDRHVLAFMDEIKSRYTFHGRITIIADLITDLIAGRLKL